MVGGTASFIAKRRNAGSAGVRFTSRDKNPMDFALKDEDLASHNSSLGEMMRQDAAKVRRELGSADKEDDDDLSISSSSTLSSSSDVSLEKESNIDIGTQVSSTDSVLSNTDSYVYNHDYTRLSMGLQKRANNFSSAMKRRGSENSSDNVSFDSGEGFENDNFELDSSEAIQLGRAERRRSSKERFANKQLVRLYNRRAFTAGLVFSKGHFLGDISKMVAGLLSSTYDGVNNHFDGDDSSAKYGFGEKHEGNPTSHAVCVNEMTIHEQEGDQLIVHSSTLAAGKGGCVALVFPKSSLIPFLDEYPGLLLSLLGTQVVL